MRIAAQLTVTRQHAKLRWLLSQKAGGGNEMDRENRMRAIGLVLLSIAIMALLLTDADAKRRSSAQRSQAAGASTSWCATYGGARSGVSENCSYAPRNNSVWPRCRGAVAFADLIRFQGRRMGRDIPGRKVRRARDT